jgi:hypothetical protein
MIRKMPEMTLAQWEYGLWRKWISFGDTFVVSGWVKKDFGSVNLGKVSRSGLVFITFVVCLLPRGRRCK